MASGSSGIAMITIVETGAGPDNIEMSEVRYIRFFLRRALSVVNDSVQCYGLDSSTAILTEVNVK